MGTIRQNFTNALKTLQNDILRMGGLVEEAIANAVRSLAKRDVTLANRVIEGDALIDRLELEIESKCMMLIATQQPLATDLRRIGAGFKIITDLERMADYAEDIAEITTRIAHEPLIKPLIDIPKMAEITQGMVRDSLDAFVREDVSLVYEMAKRDDLVDSLHRQVFEELQVYMSRDPNTIFQATYLLFVSRYLERIADHATNIGERVIYLVTGERVDLNS
ncbi:phosphate signaling complex protein PhoU [Zhaonella formicivorans]|jgi:phosphate transport system protein|uniref:phosphate signaling complex protein PhoU n=1 Tax=Zhaonella formicivorans TaxID=2528593 RepID=UPI0010E778DB